MTPRYLEDFAVGQTYGSGHIRIEGDRIKSFAAEFDPQPFHLDDDAARNSIFRGLAASGWHTAALTMRLLVESELKPAGGIVGAGFDEFRWPHPVRPGDELRVENEVIEVRPSKSRPRPQRNRRRKHGKDDESGGGARIRQAFDDRGRADSHARPGRSAHQGRGDRRLSHRPACRKR